MTMTDYELQIRKKLKYDFVHYAEKCLKITPKEAQLVPFVLNKAQLYIHERIQKQLNETGKVRAIILKGRQQGCSTYVAGRYYHIVSHNFGKQAFILTHEASATQNLYKMVNRFYNNTPDLVKPLASKSNAQELIFGQLDSGYKLGTAKNKNVGRSATIHLFHGSEVAFWDNTSHHVGGLFNAIPNSPGSEIILESTANGVGDFFHQQWQMAEAGISEYIAIFVPWFWQPEYREKLKAGLDLTEEERELKVMYGLDNEQLNWRRLKIMNASMRGLDGVKKFKQDFPCNPTEAFIETGDDFFISADVVMQARKCESVEKYGKLVIGVDPARFGDDRTAIIRRQGRVAYNLETYTKKDNMQIAGIVNKIIQDEKPFKVFVDVGGLGAGVVDRLNELGHKNVIVPVNFGSNPLDAKAYFNKRAEMWALCKKWLIDYPCKIPDDDSLHADLCGVKYDNDSISRLILEDKKLVKKRGVRSPDAADALCLTFALPESAYYYKESNGFASELANSTKRAKNLRSKANGGFNALRF